MKRTLVIVHVQPGFFFDVHLEPNKGKMLANRIDRYLKTEKFDEIINVSQPLEGLYPELVGYRQEEWIWGFVPDNYEEQGYTEGIHYIKTKAHPYSFIDDWLRDLPKDGVEYTLCGGYQFAYLADVVEIFDHLNLNYKLEYKLIY